MGKVVSSASMSLDGYIAQHDNQIGRLFDWYDSGDVVVETAMPGLTFHLSPPTAQYVRGWTASLGALVVGRTLFDFTDGWGGRHPFDVPVVVVTHHVPTEWVDTHPHAPYSFDPTA
jgi:dihydrofolate reductase